MLAVIAIILVAALVTALTMAYFADDEEDGWTGWID
jgi:predicted ribosomally synthesized peptide with SipW-like signal peptide